MSAANAPHLSRRLSMSAAVFAVVGILSGGVVIYLATDRQKPRTETVEVTVPKVRYVTVLKVEEVETVDGKKVRAKVPRDTPVMEQAQRIEEATRELGPEQKLRLTIVAVATGLLLLFTVALIVVAVRKVYRGQQVPKFVEDWLNRLAGLLVGIVTTFMGTPPPEGQLKLKEPAAAQPVAIPEHGNVKEVK